ncbi:unnamed protein product [Rhizophagus irregularis]|nr:unnamed protein product [Rhizophagus irregularis]
MKLACLKLNENTWGFIVNWAKLQIPTLTTQVTKWNKSDWEEFKQTLSPCIPWKILLHQLKKECSSNSNIRSPISFQLMKLFLNICHATLISSWIDKRDTRPYLPADIPYEFRLTVVVFKSNKSTAVYGGYNPLDWKFDHATSDSFIFHFDSNVSDLTRLDRFAIQRRTGYGPCFGAEGFVGFS